MADLDTFLEYFSCTPFINKLDEYFKSLYLPKGSIQVLSSTLFPVQFLTFQAAPPADDVAMADDAQVNIWSSL